MVSSPAAPLLSVVTICYNDSAHLERTLLSVKSQKETFPHIQYIVVDGASTDDTPRLLEQYASTIDLVISEPDKGIYDAMNKGLKKATGDYVCFLNSGDVFHSEMLLRELFEELEKKYPSSSLSEKPGVLYGQTHLVDEEGRFVAVRKPEAPQELSYRSFLRGMCVCHQSFYARRDLTEPYDSETYRLSGDFDWCLGILHKSKDNWYSGMVLTDYLNEGLTTRNRIPSLKERLHIMIDRYGLVPALLAHLYFLLRLPFKN